MDKISSSVVLSQAGNSALDLSIHPLPILNISEHLTRRKLQTGQEAPFIIGALIGTQTGRDIEIVNTFELVLQGDQDATYDGSASSNSVEPKIDHDFLTTRRDQYKSVFPALEFLGWYTYAPVPSQLHADLSEQFSTYSSSPLLLMLTPTSKEAQGSQLETLPILAFEPTIEIKDRKSRTVFAEVSWKIQTGEAERIAVDWTARGGGGEDDLTSHLQTQRAAYKMLHDRIVILVQYVADVLEGKAPKNHDVLRALAALVASLPASESSAFRDEFSTEYADVQLTTYLSSLTKTASILNDCHLPTTSANSKMIQTIGEAIKATLRVQALYQLLYSYVFGATLWGSFIAGFIAFRAIPRQQFGLLQSRTFPVFFSTSTGVTIVLLGIWTATHNQVLVDTFDFSSPAVIQAWVLALAAMCNTVNLVYLGPKTTETMFKRHKLERAEKVQYSDPLASNEMKALNKQFGALHGISSLLNLCSLFCLAAHGVSIGNTMVL
ncbi:unnamed protein product [Rhizoctonia solani]|nr:unnamed protein product [Rhizoctonia solani]